MKTNFFGDARPETADEIIELLIDVNPDDVNVELTHNEGETQEHFNGWCAEVRRNEDGEEVFSTCGFKNKDDLIQTFKTAGITDIYANE